MTLQHDYETFVRRLQGVDWPQITEIFVLIHDKDPHTAAHGLAVAKLCAGYARAHGWLRQKTIKFAVGGLLHDAGKLAVPSGLLEQPEALRNRQTQAVRSHPLSGFNFLIDRGLNGTVALMALLHHERVNGSGYPYGLASARIPLTCQLVGIIDEFEALVSHFRPYRRPLRPNETLERLRCEAKNGLYQQHLVKDFACSLPKEVMT